MDAPRISGFEHLFVPASEPSSRLAVVLHGLGDSLDGFRFLPEALGLARLNYLLLNAPLPYFVGHAWYDLDDPEPGILSGRALLRKLFADLAGQDWPSRDALLFGFSQGSLMSLDFGLRYEQPLAGIVAISGYAAFMDRLEAEMHPQARRQAWLVTHGYADELLPIARTRGQMERLRAAGVPIEWHEFAKGHSLDPEEELPLIRDWIAARWP